MVDRVWLEAAAAVSAHRDAELRADAAEVFASEAARIRLVDLHGPLAIRVRCGQVLRGQRDDQEPVDGHLSLRPDPGTSPRQILLVPSRAVISIEGSVMDLRPELDADRGRSLASWLRERWQDGEVLRILDRSGLVHAGPVEAVGADHVRLTSSQCIAYDAVDAWWA